MIKNKLINFTVIILIIFSLAAIILDLLIWKIEFIDNDNNLSEKIDWLSKLFRFSRTLLIFLFIPPIFLKRISTFDANILIFILLLAIIADFWLIIFDKLIIGILFFSIMQILLIIRNLYPFRFFKSQIKWYLTGALLFLSIYLINLFIFKDLVENKYLLFGLLFYFLLLNISAFSAWCSIKNKVLPKKSGYFILAGMIFFILCDITVGIGAIFPNESQAVFLRAFTAVFYTPALIFIAYSGINSKI